MTDDLAEDQPADAIGRPPATVTDPGLEPDVTEAASTDAGVAPEAEPLAAPEPPIEPTPEAETAADPEPAEQPATYEPAAPDAEPASPGAESEAEPEPVAPPPPAPEPIRTVGRYIADALRAVGVRYAFTVPGESFLGLLEGLDGAGIRIVATRHEGAAAFMAEAHGQLTGRPAICIGTRGVGAANLAIGIHTATQDSSPMFALVGQVERPFRGREAFQEIDQTATIGGLARHAAEITEIAATPAVVGAAIRAVLGTRPGPALISIPEDLLD